MCKMSNILLVVASMFVLVAGDCMQEVNDFETKAHESGHSPVTGGYQLIIHSESDEVVKKIVADGIKAQNERSNDNVQYVDNHDYTVYRQIVNGENYCCLFIIKSNGCKTKANSEACNESKLLRCIVEAYRAFTETFAHIIKPESMTCAEVWYL